MCRLAATVLTKLDSKNAAGKVLTIFPVGISSCAEMWQLEPTSQWEKDVRHYEKKRPTELAAVLRNLDRYIGLLRLAPNSRTVAAGYLHPEPLGVVAVDQKGGGGSLQETRLYTYADDEKQVVYLITIGSKDDQPSDIEFCKRFVESLRSVQ